MKTKTIFFSLIFSLIIFFCSNIFGQGNKIEDNSYTSDRTLIKKFTYKYDENNNKIENSRFTSDGNIEKNILINMTAKEM